MARGSATTTIITMATRLHLGCSASLFRHTTMAMGRSTIFFKNVCQGVSFTASPKQPQSPMGNTVALSRVIMVKRSRKSVAASDTYLRNMPIISNIPIAISTIARATAMPSERGSSASREYVARYLSTKTEVPTGSTHLTRPEKIKTPPSNQRSAITPICFALGFTALLSDKGCYMVHDTLINLLGRGHSALRG